ncbi:PEP-utilizing enzyme [Leptospira ilyithenensis]|uniref:Phosphoenolpyruvate synthase n=1 Tax=Leptospira ilyithenensis TaxID=2484901 RepID=A0A4V3JWX5_9LEPT|nr:PEP-utilizing enzyme [Leptospira ilyithenensis]TGN08008.1 hypothetical protein EHS11_13805 [Leptospira ilyithenensis]
MNFSNQTKASILFELKKIATTFKIENLFFFTQADWSRSRTAILEKIKTDFPNGKLVVRSSALSEDSTHESMAGYFKSIINVPTSDPSAIETAIEEVFESYKRGDSVNELNQILIQAQTENVHISGVILTRAIGNNAPYYVINYDDSGETDTVTSGKVAKSVAISRFVKEPYQVRWANLLYSIKEIESYFSSLPLDIEFAVKKSGEVVIFQVRSLAANFNLENHQDDYFSQLIENMKQKFVRYNSPVPHLSGKNTIYGDMPDWNPAEIIGDKPATLAYTLYRFLITNNIWHEARSLLGYFDVFPGELMTSFGRKPYIDTRLSFNSFVPASISKEVRDKLVKYYIDQLAIYPERQDKVEFEILWTCYDFSLEERIKVLEKFDFPKDEISNIIHSLKSLTLNIIDTSEKIFDEDLKSCSELSSRRDLILTNLERENVSFWELMSGAHYILDNCRKFGTRPFSRLARLAFIGTSILRSLTVIKQIDEKWINDFFLSVSTVAKKFSDDFDTLNKGLLDISEFISLYGHLRAGTYDINSPRYDHQLDSIMNFQDLKTKEKITNHDLSFRFDDEVEGEINSLLKASGFDTLTANSLLEFIRKSIEYRELSKFEFTKSLSDALELIAKAGEIIGISREEIQYADLGLLLSFRNMEGSDVDFVKNRISSSIERHKKDAEVYRNLILPEVISKESDFEYIEFYDSRPNYITDKQIEGDIVAIEKKISSYDEIAGKIILIESADPGYDWIFGLSPLGLVTKFGGSNSHMAIRCAEFGIAAVIGCGNIKFEHIKKHKRIRINCNDRKIDFLL